ncbi:MAG: hypothetical protein LBJ20_07050 [Candidatus Methanoplasma sp.]|jgi:hypothetical protein|nr:hypothetical protein [Candidatus Methanoplasma sp.]
MDNEVIVQELKRKSYLDIHSMDDRSYHYIPYKMDSKFEIEFYKKLLTLSKIQDLGLEVYYNGDRGLTDFHIRCYKIRDKSWIYLGKYTPDFLIIHRTNNIIDKMLLIETKGGIYSSEPIFRAKKEFIEREFIKRNNEKYGYRRFDYLYVEDTMDDTNRNNMVVKLIDDFFTECD